MNPKQKLDAEKRWKTCKHKFSGCDPDDQEMCLDCKEFEPRKGKTNFKQKKAAKSKRVKGNVVANEVLRETRRIIKRLQDWSGRLTHVVRMVEQYDDPSVAADHEDSELLSDLTSALRELKVSLDDFAIDFGKDSPKEAAETLVGQIDFTVCGAIDMLQDDLGLHRKDPTDDE